MQHIIAPNTEPEKQVIACPVCDFADYSVIYEPTVTVKDPLKLYGAASNVTGTQRIVRCKNCELLYENPRFPEEVILSGYRQSEESVHDSQYPMRVKSFYRTLQSLKKFLPPKDANILDVGTAGGAFLEAAKNFGYQPSGLEPSQFLVEQGVKRGFDIRCGTVETNPFPKNSFDMICLWDVIEHLTEPKKTLLTLKEWLRPGGILLINYPDVGTWQAKLTGRRFWWITSVHLCHFSKKTIAEICRKAGFTAFHFQRYWQILEFGYLEQVAVNFKIPLSGWILKATPHSIRRLPLPYYASQTTVLARLV